MSLFSAADRVRAVRSMFFCSALLAALILAGPLSSAHADITPKGNVDSSPSALPSAWTDSTTGYIGNTASGTLTVDGGSKLYSMYGYIGHDRTATGVVNVSGDGSTWTNDYYLYVGNSGSGTLSISSGGTVSSSSGGGVIGNSFGSTGAVNVSGTRSAWTNSSNLYVGNSGSGTLSIFSGKVSSSYGHIGYSFGSTGVVNVSGSDSTWINSYGLYVGNSGSGTLSISNGGTVSNMLSGVSCIGYSSKSAGLVTVDGIGSAWTHIGSVYVGWRGSGTLSITNGGNVSAGLTLVGLDTDSTGTIDFGTNGGTLTTQAIFASPSQLAGTGTIVTRGLVSDVDLMFSSTSDLQKTLVFQESGQHVAVNLDMTGGSNTRSLLGVGWKGSGSLVIQNGVKVNSGRGFVGHGSNSTGVATVSGTGSTWANSESLYVGYSGTGKLSIVGGGSVTSASVSVNNWTFAN